MVHLGQFSNYSSSGSFRKYTGSVTGSITICAVSLQFRKLSGRVAGRLHVIFYVHGFRKDSGSVAGREIGMSYIYISQPYQRKRRNKQSDLSAFR